MSSELELATKHYTAFTRVSQSSTSRPGTTAKDKLTKLSHHQFAELSTDVYDELARRDEGIAG